MGEALALVIDHFEESLFLLFQGFPFLFRLLYVVLLCWEGWLFLSDQATVLSILLRVLLPCLLVIGARSNEFLSFVSSGES